MAFWIDSPIQPDVNYVVNLVYTSGPLSLVNYSNFEDPMVDELIETGAGIVDAEQRLEHHKGVQQRIQEQSAFGWTVEPYFRIGLSSNLKGWRWVYGAILQNFTKWNSWNSPSRKTIRVTARGSLVRMTGKASRAAMGAASIEGAGRGRENRGWA